MTANSAIMEVDQGQSVGLVSVMTRIITLAAPLAISACVLSGLNLGMVTVLARHGDTQALHLMSLMQPAFFFIIATMEGLSITNQVFSARCKNTSTAGTVVQSSRALSLVGVLLLAVIAALAYFASRMLSLQSESLKLILTYLPMATLSMAAFLVFEIHHSALRGGGRALFAIVPFATAALLSLIVTYVLLDQYQMGFAAVLVGYFAGPLMLLPIVVVLVRRLPMKEADVTATLRDIRSVWPLLWTVGFPVFFSIVVASASAAFVFPVIDRLGADEVSAFLVVLRLRVAFTIPAVAAGSAIAILINQSMCAKTHLSGTQYLAVGVPLVFAVYAVGTVAVLLLKTTAIGLIVPESATDLNIWSNNLIWLLLPTFFLMPCVVCIQIILEQIGDGTKVLVFTMLAEAATIYAIVLSAQSNETIGSVSHILTVSSALTFAVYVARIVYVLHLWEKNHAL